MRAYATDLRERIVQAVKEGIPRREILKTYKISLATLKRYLQMEREQGSLARRSRRQYLAAPRKTIISEELLKSIIMSKPDATIKELCYAWYLQEKVWPSIATMWRAVKSLSAGEKPKTAKGLWQ